MSDIFPAFKTPGDSFDVGVTFSNTIGNPYVVQSIQSATATRQSDGAVLTSTILDSSKYYISGNMAGIWFKNAGSAGEVYTIVVTAVMTTGQILTKTIILKIVSAL